MITIKTPFKNVTLTPTMFPDGTWRYENSYNVYRWMWKDDQIWWSTINSCDQDHWIKWTTYFVDKDQVFIEMLKDLVIEGSLLKDCDRD